MRVEPNLAVPMRDGTVLRADAYLPDSGAPAPAILCRTPYDRSLSLTPPAAIGPERATEAGFVLVVQDVRGRHDSEGEFRTFASESADGYDTVEWVAAQDWCDGAVGMAGRSYCGATQWRAAVEAPPSLRAIFPVVVGSDYYHGWIYQGGAFELGFNLFWLHLMTDARGRGSLDEHYRHLPLLEAPLIDQSPMGGMYREWLAHPEYDEYWRAWSIRVAYDQVRVPAFSVGGWYDIFLGGTLENFTRARETAATQAAREGSRLLVGPWGHGSAYGAYPDHRLPGLEAEIDLDGIQLEFFAEHLRGAAEAAGSARVRIFVMGENRWRDEDDWPLTRAQPERWHLRAGGELSQEPAEGDPPDEYHFDPADPAPTIGGPTSMPGRMMKPSAGPLDQSPAEDRDDVLVYSSAPLEQPLEVTGPLRLVLFAATSAADADFVGKLCDVDPDGRSHILAEGVLRMRFRDGFERSEPAEPGRPYELSIDLVATSNVFLPGHRIRLLITSSSFPRFDRNAGIGGPPGSVREGDFAPAQQRVYHDPERPSHLLLPVVPR